MPGEPHEHWRLARNLLVGWVERKRNPSWGGNHCAVFDVCGAKRVMGLQSHYGCFSSRIAVSASARRSRVSLESSLNSSTSFLAILRYACRCSYSGRWRTTYSTASNCSLLASRNNGFPRTAEIRSTRPVPNKRYKKSGIERFTFAPSTVFSAGLKKVMKN